MTLNDIEQRLIDTRIRLLNELKPLHQDQLDHHLGGESWTIGEIVHHLSVAERQVSLVIRSMAMQARKQKNTKSLPPEIKHSPEGLNLDESALENPAVESTEPQSGLDKQELIDHLYESRKELGPCLTHARDLDLRANVYPHPYLGDLNAYQWLVVVAEHEEVHIVQIQKMLEVISQEG